MFTRWTNAQPLSASGVDLQRRSRSPTYVPNSRLWAGARRQSTVSHAVAPSIHAREVEGTRR